MYKIGDRAISRIPWIAIVFATFASPAIAQVAKVEPLVFVSAHCIKCHNEKKSSGEVRLDDLTLDMKKDGKRWQLVAEQLRDGLMPPKKETQPESKQREALIAWIVEHASGTARKLPNHGNLIPHELLFGKPAGEVKPSSERVWRLSPDGYMGFIRDITRGKNSPGIVQPFTLTTERGIKDFAELYTIDEPSTEILIRNSEAIVLSITAHEIKNGKPSGKNDSIRELVALMDPITTPEKTVLSNAIQKLFTVAIARTASDDEVTRLIGLYEKCAKSGDRVGAARTMLQAILLRTDAMYRNEMSGKSSSGKSMLQGRDLGIALSLALGEHRDVEIMKQTASSANKEQLSKLLEQRFADPKFDQSNLLKFFREYFEYHNATNVFKDKPKTFVHEPRQYVADTDRLIKYILMSDKDVFRQLLTTDQSFVNYTTARNKKLQIDEAKPSVVLNPNNNKGQSGVEFVYGVVQWEPNQPMKMPANTRLGILMQPSWLTAFSTNFDNDPVRRGRWIRERLLGGTVPDLPIGVAAMVPNDPHRTFRDRLTVTRAAQCWKCHQRMDDLGLPFENFDHYGLFRKTEAVVDIAATEKNVDKKGKSLGTIFKEVTLDTSGLIAESGDPKLDGSIRDPREMLTKLANSDRTRQVFIRHLFRFFMGRNESLSDARTLQEADKVYLASGGSFKALVISLLTSDSFLYRTTVSLTKDNQ